MERNRGDMAQEVLKLMDNRKIKEWWEGYKGGTWRALDRGIPGNCVPAFWVEADPIAVPSACSKIHEKAVCLMSSSASGSSQGASV